MFFTASTYGPYRARAIKKLSVAKSYYDRIIRNGDDCEIFRLYITNNSIKKRSVHHSK